MWVDCLLAISYVVSLFLLMHIACHARFPFEYGNDDWNIDYILGKGIMFSWANYHVDSETDTKTVSKYGNVRLKN